MVTSFILWVVVIVSICPRIIQIGIFCNSMKAETVIVGAGAAVVHIDFGAGQGRDPGDVLIQDGILGGDAVALPLVAVLPGEVGVEGSPPAIPRSIVKLPLS